MQLSTQHEFKSGQRKDARIDFPARITINQTEIEVSEWSLGGFSIKNNLLHESELNTQEAKFSFCLPQGKLELDIIFKVIRVSKESFVIGFQFVELSDYIKETMNSIIGGYLSGEKISLDDSLQKGIKGKMFEFEQTRLLANWGKFALVVGSIISIIAFAIFLLFQKFYIITSEHAAVAQKVVKIQSTTAGIIEGVKFKPGKKFLTDEPMFSLFSDNQRELLRQKKSEFSSLTLEITHIENRYQDAKALLASFSERLDSDGKGLMLRIKAIEAEIKVQSKQYELFVKNYNKGVIDEVSKGDNVLKLYEKKRKLLILKQKLDINENLQKMTAKGLLARDDVSSLPTVHELGDLLAYKNSYLNLLSNEIEQLNNNSVFRSPCDCRVVEVNTTNGPITLNKPILQLTPVSENPKWIIALLPLKDDKRLYKGAKANFRLASESDVRTGKIEEISYYSASQPVIYSSTGETISGLPDSLPRMQQFTLVKILPDELLNKVSFKEPAVVSIYLGFFNWLRSEAL
jgi:multidrug resistance efflux pump